MGATDPPGPPPAAPQPPPAAPEPQAERRKSPLAGVAGAVAGAAAWFQPPPPAPREPFRLTPAAWLPVLPWPALCQPSCLCHMPSVGPARPSLPLRSSAGCRTRSAPPPPACSADGGRHRAARGIHRPHLARSEWLQMGAWGAVVLRVWRCRASSARRRPSAAQRAGAAAGRTLAAACPGRLGSSWVTAAAAAAAAELMIDPVLLVETGQVREGSLAGCCGQGQGPLLATAAMAAPGAEEAALGLLWCCVCPPAELRAGHAGDVV